MGIVYLARNKKKNPFSLYALVSQYLLTILVLTIGGYLLGRYIIGDDVLWGGILATVGAICGIIIFIMEMLKLGKEDERD